MLESRFFQAIDQQGRKSIDAILEKGVEALGSSERSDFARLMLSLEWRRPKMVERLRTEGTAKLIAELDDDPAIVDELRRQGIDETPSRFAQRRFGWSLEDRAMLIIQKLVDSRAVGERVINAYWFTKRLRHDHGCFMLGDRPLVRTHGLGHEAATWFIPLSPKVGFFATLHANNRRLLQKASARTIVEKANISTAAQAERFVFSVEKFFPPMMAAYLRPSGVAELNQLPHKGASPTAG